MEGNSELIKTNTNSAYTITGTDKQVLFGDFEVVKAYVGASGPSCRGNSPCSFRLNAPQTDLYIRVEAKTPITFLTANSDAIHMTRWVPELHLRNCNAYVNTEMSDALNISRDADGGQATFESFTAVVERGNGMRANASTTTGKRTTISVANGTDITISKNSGGLVLNPSAVFAGSDIKDPDESSSKGYASIDLNGLTKITLKGKGNHGIWAAKNGTINVEDVLIESNGANSYGIAATGGTLHNQNDTGPVQGDTVVFLDGNNYEIQMHGTDSYALYVSEMDSENLNSAIRSVECGIDSLQATGDVYASRGEIDILTRGATTIEGDIEARSSGQISLTSNAKMSIVGTVSSSSNGTVNLTANSGLSIKSGE